MSLSTLLQSLRPAVEKRMIALQAPWPTYTLFLSLCDGHSRARVLHATGEHFDTLWRDLGVQCQRLIAREKLDVCWLKADWITKAQATTCHALRTSLKNTKRNYFRHGLALDPQFQTAFLEQELNGNAMLYGGNAISHAVINEQNFARYARQRFRQTELDFSDDKPIYLFSSQGVFCSTQTQAVLLHPTGLHAGRRIIDPLEAPSTRELIESAGRYLSTQVQANGRFEYGWHSCFDRPIKTYNALRHASTSYAMLEAWEITRDPALLQSIEKALDYLTEQLIKKSTLQDGTRAAFLVDQNDEIKLGGNAVCLLALTQYASLFNNDRYHNLLEQLAEGIRYMQNASTGQFVHVLNYPDLSTKEDFRIIYYDGEAAFGLMRLYKLTRDERWLELVEKAFEHFIAAKHWKAHDHWLGYCVNELTLYRPEERYYRFGIQNVAGHLDFVEKRITTFPTLLEMMMAAQAMLTRIQQTPALQHLLHDIDMQKFRRALRVRANYLMNGHMWPEYAMYFKNPQRILGGFFIRHHAFRVRIDDVEHYLSGYVAYYKYLCELQAQATSGIKKKPVESIKHTIKPSYWNASDVITATGGTWITPPPEDWSATGLCTYLPTRKPGYMVIIHSGQKGSRGVPLPIIKEMIPAPSCIITSRTDINELPGIPILQVANVNDAIMSLGTYARSRISGNVLAITGSSGKTTTVAMLAHALQPWGETNQTVHNANLPHGVAWNLASMNWHARNTILELAVGRMARSATMARPQVAIFTNISPAHLDETSTVRDIARTKSKIFLGMNPGDVAIINRDMQEWHIVHDAACKRDLRIIHYGATSESEFQLLGYDSRESQVTAKIHGRELLYQVGAPGHHMAMNSLAVLAAAEVLGYSPTQAAERLCTFGALPGRGEELQLILDGKHLTVIDDTYNANPGSMASALESLSKKTVSGRAVAVLGEMAELGSQAEYFHTQLEEVIQERNLNIDRFYLLGDLYKNFWNRLPQALRGKHARSLSELKPVLRSELKDNDIVLFKGSNSTHIHQLFNWLKTNFTVIRKNWHVRHQRAPGFDIPKSVSALLYAGNDDSIVFAQNETKTHPPASITKILTLCLVEEKLQIMGLSHDEVIEVSPTAANINSHWGFAAGEKTTVGTLMRASAIVSANEASHALAEWHSGSVESFTALLNEKAEKIGLHDTCFSSPSGLGRKQETTARDILLLSNYVLNQHPQIAALCSEPSFSWNGQQQTNTNRLLTTVEGADGLKTGTLAGHGNHLLLTAMRGGQRWIAIVLGAATKKERDNIVKTLIDAYSVAC